MSPPELSAPKTVNDPLFTYRMRGYTLGARNESFPIIVEIMLKKIVVAPGKP